MSSQRLKLAKYWMPGFALTIFNVYFNYRLTSKKAMEYSYICLDHEH